MLRSICFENFVKFQGFHSLTFEANRPTIFLGANSTGKSSVYELIRRCMTDDINASVSASYDDNRTAYIFCVFDIPITANQNLEQVCSGVIKTPGNKLTTKIVWWKDSKTRACHLSVFTAKINEDKGDCYQEVENVQSHMKDIAENNTKKSVGDLLHFLERVGVIKIYDPEEGRTVLQRLESMYVATLPLRSIGICQWTRSENLLHKDEHYKTAVGRAEMLRKLMSYSDDRINREKADRIFRNITYPAEFKFTYNEENEEINVSDTESDMTFPLLKCPEGVLEARLFSLLIALKNVYTLCLEEPERGMHPQYVERIRNMLTIESKDKTLMIVTHSPFLINTITAENAFVFFRKASQSKGKTPYGFEPIKEISRQITDIDELKKLIFASHVLFVEGKTDKIIVEGLYEWYIDNKEQNDIQHIVNRQIVVLDGKDRTDAPKNFCRNSFINCVWLFDRDKYIRVDKKSNKIEKVSIPGVDDRKYKEKDMTELSNEAEFKSLMEDIEKKDNAFCWKDGELEEAIRKSLNDDDFIEIFRQNPKDILNEAMKKDINKIGREDLRNLIGYLMKSEKSKEYNEFNRFYEFLCRMGRRR